MIVKREIQWDIEERENEGGEESQNDREEGDKGSENKGEEKSQNDREKRKGARSYRMIEKRGKGGRGGVREQNFSVHGSQGLFHKYSRHKLKKRMVVGMNE